MEENIQKEKKKKQAKKNKQTGAKFEGVVKKIFYDNNFFILPKGVSTIGLDIFGMNKNLCIGIELKSHIKYLNYQYKNAKQQLFDNFNIINNFINKTKYDNYICALVYYIRNTKLIIENIDGIKKEYIKTYDIKLDSFLIESFIDYGFFS